MGGLGELLMIRAASLLLTLMPLLALVWPGHWKGPVKTDLSMHVRPEFHRLREQFCRWRIRGVVVEQRP